MPAPDISPAPPAPAGAPPAAPLSAGPLTPAPAPPAPAAALISSAAYDASLAPGRAAGVPVAYAQAPPAQIVAESSLRAAAATSLPPAAAPATTVSDGVTVSDLSATGAVLSWTTVEAGRGRVEYAPSDDPTNLTITPQEQANVTLHRRTLANLAPAQVYVYRAVVGDDVREGRFTTAADA